MAIRVRNVPAVVEWTNTSSTPRSFHNLDDPSVQLNLYFDEEEQTAIFQIRVLLEGTAHHDGVYLYLWIHPRDVILLLQDPAHHPQDGVSSVLCGPTTCLRVVLSRPASVVAPSGFLLPSREGPGPPILESLMLLAKQTVVTIHLEQRLVPGSEEIQQICQAFCNGSVKQHPRHDTLRDFYKGQDAMIIEDLAGLAGSKFKPGGQTIDVPSSACDAVTPPPYAEAPSARPPPSLFAPRPSNKRQRFTADVSKTLSADIDGVYTELLAQQKAQMHTFFSLQQAQMARILACMGTQVDRMPDHIISRVDKRVNEEMLKIWDKKPHEWETVTRNIVQQEVDYALESSLPGKLEELQDAVRDECLDHLKDELEGGLVTITLPR